jgi:hypothetical protein
MVPTDMVAHTKKSVLEGFNDILIIKMELIIVLCFETLKLPNRHYKTNSKFLKFFVLLDDILMTSGHRRNHLSSILLLFQGWAIP